MKRVNLTPSKVAPYLRASTPLSIPIAIGRRGEGKLCSPNVIKSRLSGTPITLTAFFFLLAFYFFSCETKKQETIIVAEEASSTNPDLISIGKITLSEYGFFKGALKDLSPLKE